MRRLSAWGVAAAMLVACSGNGPREASLAEQEVAARVSAGELLFSSYCAACHGASGRGDGPAAPSFRVPPADLTQIAVRHGGFDAAEVAAYIDGRTEIAAHGRREMPVWGRRYDDRNNQILTDETLLSPGMIFNIVDYLRTLQMDESGRNAAGD